MKGCEVFWPIMRIRYDFYHIHRLNFRLTHGKIATVWWVGFSHLPGNLRRVHITDVPITRAFYPTVDRPYVWLVEFWHLPVKWVFVALPIGMLVTLLFYYDHASVPTVNM